MSNLDNDEDFVTSYVTTLVMELYYVLDDPLFMNHPLFTKGVKNFTISLHRAIQSHISDKYFGVKKVKGLYGEATEESQVNLFENIKYIGQYHKKALLLKDEQRQRIQNILNEVDYDTEI